jgi:hypothetical protein
MDKRNKRKDNLPYDMQADKTFHRSDRPIAGSVNTMAGWLLDMGWYWDEGVRMHRYWTVFRYCQLLRSLPSAYLRSARPMPPNLAQWHANNCAQCFMPYASCSIRKCSRSLTDDMINQLFADEIVWYTASDYSPVVDPVVC